jgi:hypothetical protein
LQPGRVSVIERGRHEDPRQTADGAVAECNAYRQCAESPTQRLDVEADVETESVQDLSLSPTLPSAMRPLNSISLLTRDIIPSQ